MDDNAKNTCSYQLDQEILDVTILCFNLANRNLVYSRGIEMTVEEVAGLSTCKYSERVQSLKLKDEDMAFLKGLRRRIKNRLASQNSRRRSVEHLRRLARELRAVKECRDDALSERRALVSQRDDVRERAVKLRRYIKQILQERSDFTELPSIDVEVTQLESPTTPPKVITVTETKTPLLPECFTDNIEKTIDNTNFKIFENSNAKLEKNIFECRIDKLVQQSVNHIFKNETDKKKVFAKTVFISNEKFSSEIKSMVLCESDMKIVESDNGVLNLSLKEGRRKSHGRKQLAPRRIAYVYSDANDGVLDLKVNRESQ